MFGKKNKISEKSLKVANLYLAKCRHCIMDIINVTDEENHIMSPHPDYVHYYTILLKNEDGSFIDIMNKDVALIHSLDCERPEENYDSNIIFDYEPLSNYLKDYDKLSYRECLIALEVIKQTKGLKDTFGYKKIDETRKNRNLYTEAAEIEGIIDDIQVRRKKRGY